MKRWYSNSTLRKICDGQKLKAILPDMKRVQDRDKDVKLNMQQKRGRLIEVYDARSWPVVKSGNVYVSPDDSVENVKSSILSACGPQSKKSSKKSSKHALAIGTSFGHVHAFLKDSDGLLQEIERNRAQDKCLMLIQKPKTSSRQMLKAQSWANLSTGISDSHLYQQLDGAYHTDHRRHKAYRTKKRQSDLQLASESGYRLSNGETTHSPDSFYDTQRLRENDRRKFQSDDRLQRSELRNEVRGQYSYPYDGHQHVQSEKNWNSKQPSSNRYSLEINNNKKLSNGNRMYRSHNDIYMQFPQNSGYKSVNNTGAIKSDEFYSKNICDIQEESVLDQDSVSKLQDPVARSQSVGDLTTGLTLSLVGQRKSESIQCLSTANAPPKPPRLFQTVDKPFSSSLQNQKGRFKDNNKNIHRSNTNPNIHSDSSSGMQNGNGKLRTPKSNMKKGFSSMNTLTENQVSQEDDSLSELSIKSEQSPSKTPSKQRRTLPCIPPGEVNEKKRQYADIVKMRVSSQSHSSMSSSSRQSEFTPQSGDMGRGVETLSDREVSDLLTVQKNGNYAAVNLNNSETCNKNGYHGSKEGNKNGHYHHGNTSAGLPPSVRSCDSGHTTLTSLSSTVDSGYLTNDQDVDMYSSSSYTKSLQKSAQNLYHNNKLQVYSYGNGTRRDSSSEKPLQSSSNTNKELTSDKLNKTSRRSEINSTSNYEDIQPQYSKQNFSAPIKENDSNTVPRRVSASKTKDGSSVQNVTSPIVGKNVIINGAYSGIPGKKPVNSGFRRISDLELSSNMDHIKAVKPSFHSGQGQYEEGVTDFSSRKSKIKHYLKSNQENENPRNFPTKVQTAKGHHPKRESPNDSVMSEELQYSTLPGNWRYHGNKQDGESNLIKKQPCLFQVLQTHDLLPVRISFEENCLFSDFVKLCESQISLPSVKKNMKKETPVSSTPKGKYAHLGGPGSAFKPVKTVNSNISLVSMVTIDEILPSNGNCCTIENLQKGDVLIEVNERLVMGDPLSVVQELLQNLPGEIILTVARLKQSQNTSQESDSSQVFNVEELRKEISMLQANLQSKDQRIQELNSMLPWKQNVEEVVKKIEINGNCFPSELLANGLADDEYIV